MRMHEATGEKKISFVLGEYMGNSPLIDDYPHFFIHAIEQDSPFHLWSGGMKDLNQDKKHKTQQKRENRNYGDLKFFFHQESERDREFSSDLRISSALFKNSSEKPIPCLSAADKFRWILTLLMD